MKSIFKYIIIGLVAPLLFSSCLKDDTLIGPDAEGAITSFVEFKNISNISSSTTAPYAVYVPQTLDPETAEVTINAIVRYAGTSDAPSDIVIQLEVADKAVDVYNTSEKTAFETLPASSFEFPTTVTIKKGEREVIVPIKLHVDKFDQSKENVVPLNIKSISTNDVISGNFGTVIFSFPVKSIWEGTYTYSVNNDYGTIDANIGSFTEEDVKLSTVGPNKLYMQYLWRTYSGYTHYQFNGDNTSIASILGFSGSARPGTIDKIVIIDAEKRIFEVKWTCIGRGVTERFVRTGD